MVDNMKNVTGDETIAKDLTVGDDIVVGDDVSVGDDLAVSGDLAVTGNATVGGTLGVTGKVTADDVDLASGAIIAGLGTGANGIKLKNLKNAAAGTLGGTALNVEIDIAGTPYYFAVYPTKS